MSKLPCRLGLSLLFLPSLGLAATLAACLGEDVSSTGPEGARADAGALVDGGSPDAESRPTPSQPDASSPFVPGSCPPEATAVPCGPDLTSAGVPALHLDACKLGDRSVRITSWPSLTSGIVLQGAPGALLCRSSINGRPAVHFDRDGFSLAASQATALDGAPEHWLAVVMQYVPSDRPENQAAGIVFQRNEASYPFAGPQIAANFAYQGQAGQGMSLDRTRLLGGSMRFGLASRNLPESTFAAVTPNELSAPMLVVFHRLGDRIALRVNGKEVAFDTSTQSLPDGSGNPLNIGRANSENNYFLGKIAELLFHRSAPQDTAALEGELMARWGIAPAP